MTRLPVVQHVAHERLGSFEDGFRAARCELVTLDEKAGRG